MAMSPAPVGAEYTRTSIRMPCYISMISRMCCRGKGKEKIEQEDERGNSFSGKEKSATCNPVVSTSNRSSHVGVRERDYVSVRKSDERASRRGESEKRVAPDSHKQQTAANDAIDRLQQNGRLLLLLLLPDWAEGGSARISH